MTSRTELWQPVLTGPVAERARHVITAIAKDLSQVTDIKGPGLSGHAAFALFFTYLALATGDDRYGELAVKHHAQALRGLETLPLPMSLFGGLIGIGWMDAHLSRIFFEADDTATESEGIDEVLLDALAKMPSPRHYDLITGLTGYGVYALERLPRPSALRCVDAIVGHLVASATTTVDGVTWRTPEAYVTLETGGDFPQGVFNNGMAHGIPGVITFLAAAVDAGVADERATRLLRGAVRWVLSQQLEDGRSRFPGFVIPGEPRTPTRTAWCYGDPGVVSALMYAARTIGDERVQAVATEIGLQAAARPFGATGITDAGLCHGSAGLAQIYLRWFRMTSNPAFEEAAHLWLRQVLDMRQPGQGIGGYLLYGPPLDRAPTSRSDVTWRPDASFLTGCAGIGLALLAATSDVEPAWDRLLLLS